MPQAAQSYMERIDSFVDPNDLSTCVELMEDNYVRQYRAVVREIASIEAQGREVPTSLTESLDQFLEWLNPDNLLARARSRILRNQLREERRLRRQAKARQQVHVTLAAISGNGRSPGAGSAESAKRKHRQKERSLRDLEARRG